MIGVIELDPIMVDETDCHMWTEGEALHQELANFGLLPRLGRRACLRTDLEIHPPWSGYDTWPLFLPLWDGFRVSFSLPGISWGGIEHSFVGRWS